MQTGRWCGAQHDAIVQQAVRGCVGIVLARQGSWCNGSSDVPVLSGAWAGSWLFGGYDFEFVVACVGGSNELPGVMPRHHRGVLGASCANG